MKRYLYLIFLFAFLVRLCPAQKTENPPRVSGLDCATRIFVINRDWDRAEAQQANRLTTEQLKWWLKDGQKKFRGLCLTEQLDDANFVLYWSEKWENREGQMSVPKTQTTQQSGTVNATSTGTSGTTNTSGTYSGTSTTTTSETRSYEYSVQFIFAAVHQVSQSNTGPEISRLPVFVSDHKGYMIWSKPDKDAFIDALKYISRHAKGK